MWLLCLRLHSGDFIVAIHCSLEEIRRRISEMKELFVPGYSLVWRAPAYIIPDTNLPDEEIPILDNVDEHGILIAPKQWQELLSQVGDENVADADFMLELRGKSTVLAYCIYTDYYNERSVQLPIDIPAIKE